MLNRIEFLNQLERLTSVYSSISEMAIEEYYNKFKFFEIEIIIEAIDYLIERHEGDFMPKPPEILGVINEIRRHSSESYVGEDPAAPICPECNGTFFETWVGVDGRFKAKPCSYCSKGKRIAAGWREYLCKIYKKELIRNGG